MSSSNKRALSNMVGYVLLIVITISLSMMVYGWLKFYAEDSGVSTCPSGANLIIQKYDCFPGASGNITVYLKNKGLFDVDGYVLRVHDREDAVFGFYVLDDTGVALSPNEVYNATYDFSLVGVDNVTFLDVQPIVIEGGEKISCNAYASQVVYCGGGSGGSGGSGGGVLGVIYDGFSSGESFAEYDDGPNGPIVTDRVLPGSAVCRNPSVSDDCGINKYYSSLNLTTPHISEAGTYKITYSVEKNNNDGVDPVQDNEDYEVVCGGSVFQFLDDNTVPSFENVSINCDFSVGKNNIIFRTIPSNAESVHFYYLKIEGPI